MSKNRCILNFSLLTVSIILSLMVLEVGFRVLAYVHDRNSLTAEALTRASRIKGKKAGLGRIIKLSEHESIIYELLPDLDVIFRNADMTTSPQGFRDRSYPIQKGKGVIRIVGLGDSVMFGWGVGDSEVYLTILEQRLNERYAEKRWEVINTAVPGYNSVMELETLRYRGLPYSPDLVMIQIVGNDTDLPNFIREKSDYLALDKSFLIVFVKDRLKTEKHKFDISMTGLKQTPEIKDAFGNIRFIHDPSDVPEQYRHMVGKDAVIASLKQLQRLSVQQGFDVVVIIDRNIDGGLGVAMRDVFDSLGFIVFDITNTLNEYLGSHGISRYRGSVLTISERDLHPTALAHRLIAEDILEKMSKHGIINSLVSPG
jgi:lysophospholipase L1-like esterase